MKLSGTYTFAVPRLIVWEALQDPEVLARIMPGCETLEETGENQYEGALKIKVGPVQGKFDGTVRLSDLVPPESYRMHVDGKGPSGFVKGEGQVRLEAQGQQTVMYYEGDAHVGGRIASVGQRLMDTSARSLTRQSLEGLNQYLEARVQAESAGEEASRPVIETPTQTQVAVEVAKDVVADVVPPDRLPWLVGGVIALIVIIVILLIVL